MKKLVSLLLVLLMCVGVCASFAACGSDDNKGNSYENIKVGVILLHDENSTYDLNFMNGVESAVAALGMSKEQIIYKRNIPESDKAYEAACDLADLGCQIVFADSFGHEEYILKAAKEYPEVQFCHATGTTAHTAGVVNFHNAFASIYEGRYLAGVAAGLKLNEMIESGKITADQAVMGYVGAFTYAEVISGYTSFYLGAKSVCPSVTMKVKFTGSWYNETREKSYALELINSGCVLISQHADSMGAPSVCQEKLVPNVSYNGSTLADCPDSFIVSSRIDWAPYFTYIINCIKDNKAIDTDWTGSIATGSVVLTDINTAVAAAGTADAIAAKKALLENGTLKVFDTANFTVGGKPVTEAIVKDGGDNSVIKTAGGITFFDESGFRSAPYFELRIDGITLINEVYDPSQVTD